MKRIVKAVALVTFAGATSGVFAASTPAWPAEALQEYPLSQEFSNIDTYKKEHRDSAARQAPMTYPAAGLQVYSLSSEFPNILTYEQEHRNDRVQVSTTPTFPYEALDQVPLSSEFPNIRTYADVHRDQNGQSFAESANAGGGPR
jgi:hypothetical protein